MLKRTKEETVKDVKKEIIHFLKVLAKTSLEVQTPS